MTVVTPQPLPQHESCFPVKKMIIILLPMSHERSRSRALPACCMLMVMTMSILLWLTMYEIGCPQGSQCTASRVSESYPFSSSSHFTLPLFVLVSSSDVVSRTGKSVRASRGSPLAAITVHWKRQRLSLQQRRNRSSKWADVICSPFTGFPLLFCSSAICSLILWLLLPYPDHCPMASQNHTFFAPVI